MNLRGMVGNGCLVGQDQRDTAWLVKKRQQPRDLAIGRRIRGGREPGSSSDFKAAAAGLGLIGAEQNVSSIRRRRSFSRIGIGLLYQEAVSRFQSSSCAARSSRVPRTRASIPSIARSGIGNLQKSTAVLPGSACSMATRAANRMNRSGSERRAPVFDRNLPGRLLHEPLAGVPPDEGIRVGQRLHQSCPLTPAEEWWPSNAHRPGTNLADLIGRELHEQFFIGLGPELAEEFESTNPVLAGFACARVSRTQVGKGAIPRVAIPAADFGDLPPGKASLGRAISKPLPREARSASSAWAPAPSSSPGRGPPGCLVRRW